MNGAVTLVVAQMNAAGAGMLPALVALVMAVLIVLAVVAFVMRTRALERKIGRLMTRFEELRPERDRGAREKGKRDELASLKSDLHSELESLRSLIRNTPAETQRLLASSISQSRSAQQTSVPAAQPAPAVAFYDRHEEPREDGVAQLLSVANRIVQQSSTTLDAFRASTGALAAQVVPWPSAAEGTPAAFIVEHRGSHYAIPNVVKPARLPQEWFNRSEFGVNDEIQRVVSLPRLRRRGDSYEVQEAGVFAR